MTRNSAVAVASMALSCVALAQPAPTLIALRGQPAPGAPAGSVFDSFSAPIINDNDQVVFTATLTGPSIDPVAPDALYRAAGGALTLLLRDGDAPAGKYISRISKRIAQNNHGQVAVQVTLSDSGAAYILIDPGTITPIIFDGLAIPGTALTISGSESRPSLSSNGDVVFVCGLAGGGAGAPTSALATAGPSGLRIIAYNNGFTHNLPTIKWGSWSGHLPTINDAGVVSGVLSNSNNFGIFNGRAGELDFLYGINQGPPGFGPWKSLYVVDAPAHAATGVGSVWFGASLNAYPGSSSLIFYGDLRNPTLAVRDNTPAPGLPGLKLLDAATSPYPWSWSNEIGSLAFTMGLSGPDVTTSNDAALWLGVPPNFWICIRRGDPLPTAAPGVYMNVPFSSVQANPADQTFVLNNNDQILYLDRLFGPGVTADVDDLAIITFDPFSGVRALARTGGTLVVNGSPRTVSNLAVGGGSTAANTSARPLNNLGRAAFVATFTDDSSAVFTTIVRCPADVNGDDLVQGDDYDTFMLWFEAGGSGADFDGNGFTNGDDYDAFTAAFEAGC